MDCPPTKTVTDCLHWPYAADKWPGQVHECPSGSGTRGLTEQVNCTCNPGYWKGTNEHVQASCKKCDENTYCYEEIAEVPCGAHESSPAGSSSKAQCVCVDGYERVNGECVTNCVANPGSYCEPTQETEKLDDVIMVVVECQQGWACAGGRGASKVPCTAMPGSYCPAGRSSPAGIPCPHGFACQFGGQTDKVECTVPAGRFCPDGGTDPHEGSVCPVGFYCEGKQAAPQPCTAQPGHYCPEGSLSEEGVDCPQGFACQGGSANKIICQSAPGFYCPVASVSLSGIQCPIGSYCTDSAGGIESAGTVPTVEEISNAAIKPCTCSAGSYCPAGSSAPATGLPAAGARAPAGDPTSAGAEGVPAACRSPARWPRPGQEPCCRLAVRPGPPAP